MPPSFETFSLFWLGHGPVLCTRESWIAGRLAKVEDKGLLSPWASALVLRAEAEALLTVRVQGHA